LKPLYRTAVALAWLAALPNPALASVALALPAPAPELALTFDDLPVHGPLPLGQTRVGVVTDLVAALDAAKAPAFGFVNGAHTEREPYSAPALAVWRASGRPLGNHTWSHPSLNAIDAATFEAEVARNEPLLRDLMGEGDWRWLRYPFLAEGDTPEKRGAVRQALAADGYRIASVTLSFGDYAWNEPYARCLAKGDTAAVADLETRFLAAAASDADRARSMSKTLYGRDIPYVLLMHVGAFDARMLPRLLALYRARGFAFTTLDKAERDPFYRTDLDPSLPPEPTTLENAMRARGLTPPASPIDLAGLDGVCR
jgi:peptidoglycan/xylan/chitin deacetylase (PgdA/CDA1 family)